MKLIHIWNDTGCRSHTYLLGNKPAQWSWLWCVCVYLIPIPYKDFIFELSRGSRHRNFMPQVPRVFVLLLNTSKQNLFITLLYVICVWKPLKMYYYSRSVYFMHEYPFLRNGVTSTSNIFQMEVQFTLSLDYHSKTICKNTRFDWCFIDESHKACKNMFG